MLLISLVSVAAITDSVHADLIMGDGGVPFSAPLGGGHYVPPSKYSDTPVEDVLTYQGVYNDADKDGWVDTRISDVNPLGYVAMHFSTRWKNVRIGMGGLLGTDIIVNAPLPKIRSSYRGSGGYMLTGLPEDPSDPEPPDRPEVPEPASAVLIMFGAGSLLARRGVRARRS
jgi:hypothetical protein